MPTDPIPAEHRNQSKRQTLSVAIALWRSVLIGNAPPFTIELRDRMMNPRPGDLVMEQSTAYRLVHKNDLTDDLWDGQLTRYLRTERVNVPYDDIVDSAAPLTYEETYLICQQPDGSEFRWTNADLLAVPEGAVNEWVTR